MTYENNPLARFVIFLGFSAIVGAFVFVTLFMSINSAEARIRLDELSQVNCECDCAVRREGRETMIESKTFAAPNGDPARCGGMDGTSCRNLRSDGTTALGKLESCSAVVESSSDDSIQVVPLDESLEMK